MRQLIAQLPTRLPTVTEGDKRFGEPARVSDLNTIFSNILTVALGFGAIVLFIMLVIGGFRWMSAGGDPKAAASARNTLTYAILGIVLLALAFLILQLVAFFTGVDTILEFTIFQES